MPDISTEVAIATTTLGSAASGVTFNSIPSTYTDLRVVLNGKTTDSSCFIGLQFNGVTTGTYGRVSINGDGSSVNTNINNGNSSIPIISIDSNTNQILVTADVFSYPNTTVYKTALTSGSFDKDGSGLVIRTVGTWRSLNAISSLTLMIYNGSANTWQTGTTATLYGIL